MTFFRPLVRGALPLLVAAAGLVSGTPRPAQAAIASQGVTPPDSAWGSIGAGDKLVVRVLSQPDWSDSTLVDASGDVVLTRLGRLRVSGLALAALRDTVRTRYAQILRHPDVDVLFLRRVAVLGSVRKPDLFFVDPASTLREVLAQAGGVDEDGDLNKVALLREGQRIPLGKWRDVEQTAVPTRSGDQLVVGQRSWLSRNALTAISSLAVAVSVLVSALRSS